MPVLRTRNGIPCIEDFHKFSGRSVPFLFPSVFQYCPAKYLLYSLINRFARLPLILILQIFLFPLPG